MTATLDDYDLLIYPGFMRRPLARRNEDGSCAPVARARGPKGEAFQLMLKQAEIDEDISHIEHEVRPGAAPTLGRAWGIQLKESVFRDGAGRRSLRLGRFALARAGV
jgi:hypothetical protein